jgi:hypothetical protein
MWSRQPPPGTATACRKRSLVERLETSTLPPLRRVREALRLGVAFGIRSHFPGSPALLAETTSAARCLVLAK